MSRELVIGTRKSDLALWQAYHVEAVLPQPTRILGILSTGDLNQEIALSSFSEKGVFTKELDTALLTSTIDIAVHSMKDLPTTLPEGLVLAAVMARGSVEDCLVYRAGLEELPAKPVIGTSSLRRTAVLRRTRPEAVLKGIRGNLNTRLRKLDEGSYDAIMLAKAGLERLGMVGRVSRVLEPAQVGYAVCQGAVAVVCRESDDYVREICRGIECATTRVRCEAERAMLRTLEGGCKVPIAVVSSIDEASGHVQVRGWVMSVDGTQVVDKQVSGTQAEARDTGDALAHLLLDAGGKDILEKVRQDLKEV